MANRILAIDWGEKRLGIAITDPMNLIAQPLSVLIRKGRSPVWEDLRKLIEPAGVRTVVVGIPLRTDGKPGEKEAEVRRWIREAQLQFPGVTWMGVDERFTTRQAQRILRDKGISSRNQRHRVDQMAAALILEQFLLSRSHP